MGVQIRWVPRTHGVLGYMPSHSMVSRSGRTRVIAWKGKASYSTGLCIMYICLPKKKLQKVPAFYTNHKSLLFLAKPLCHSQLEVVTVIMGFRRSVICVGYNERDEGKGKTVDCELEAAQALAGLAHPSMLPGPSTRPGASGHASPPPPLLDLYHFSGGAQDGEDSVDGPQNEGLALLSSNVLGGSEIVNSTTLFSSCNYDYSSFSGCKSRRSVAEEEKEAQRLRRVVANRESARQTIRRRQAMYHELTRNAAHLALENQNLKKEKELAAKEYDGLKSTNESLRAQMTKAVKKELQGTHEVSYPVQVMSSSTSTAHPFFYNHTPVVQHGSQNYSTISSVGEPTTPLLVLPFPWFIPFHSPGQYFPQSYSDHNESSSPQPVKDKAGDSISSRKHVHTEMTLHFQSGLETHHPEHADLMASSMTSTGQVKTQDSSLKDQHVVTFPVKNSEEAMAATEARRWRKNKMKLKTLHCRPHAGSSHQ